MANAIDAFRAQRDAANQVHQQLLEVTRLLASLQKQVTAITRDGELAALVRAERTWLARLEDALADARGFREQELQRFWPGVFRRWAVAMAFAFLAFVAIGAGYVRAVQPYAEETAALRRRAELFDVVVERVIEMSPAERRRFDVLLRGEESR